MYIYTYKYKYASAYLNIFVLLQQRYLSGRDPTRGELTSVGEDDADSARPTCTLTVVMGEITPEEEEWEAESEKSCEAHQAREN